MRRDSLIEDASRSTGGLGRRDSMGSHNDFDQSETTREEKSLWERPA